MTAILLLSAGRRVELLQSIISAAHDLLPADFRVLAADATPELSAACSFADDSFVLPRVNDPDYLSCLRLLCVQQNICLLIPTIDSELLILAEERKRLASAGIMVLISDAELVSFCVTSVKLSIFSSIGLIRQPFLILNH